MSSHDELLRKRAARDAGIDPYAPAPPDPDDVELGLEAIRQQAMQVAEDFEDFEEAIMIERESAAAILETALNGIKPALGALVGKIETRRASQTMRDGDGKLQLEQRGKVNYYSKRGALIVNKFSVIQDVPDVAGAYGGMGLFVLEGGSWAIGLRSGTWSRRIGESSVLELDVASVSSVDILQHFRVEAVLVGLVEALGKQDALGGATERTRQRTAVLREGLITLLQGLKA